MVSTKLHIPLEYVYFLVSTSNLGDPNTRLNGYYVTFIFTCIQYVIFSVRYFTWSSITDVRGRAADIKRKYFQVSVQYVYMV